MQLVKKSKSQYQVAPKCNVAFWHRVSVVINWRLCAFRSIFVYFFSAAADEYRQLDEATGVGPGGKQTGRAAS